MVQKFYAMSQKFITDRILIYVIHSTTTIITGLLILLLHHPLQKHLPNANTKSWGSGYGKRICFEWPKETQEGIYMHYSIQTQGKVLHLGSVVSYRSSMRARQLNLLLSSFTLLALWHSPWNKINFWCWVYRTHTLHCTLGHNQTYNTTQPWQSKVQQGTSPFLIIKKRRERERERKEKDDDDGDNDNNDASSKETI